VYILIFYNAEINVIECPENIQNSESASYVELLKTQMVKLLLKYLFIYFHLVISLSLLFFCAEGNVMKSPEDIQNSEYSSYVEDTNGKIIIKIFIYLF